MLENKICRCPTCSSQLKKKDNRKTAVFLLISGVLIFPSLFAIAHGTIVPYVYLLINIVMAIRYCSKKERFFYFCKSCYKRYSEKELKMTINGVHDIIT